MALIGNRNTVKSSDGGVRAKGATLVKGVAPKGGTLQGENGEEIAINNALQLVDRLELSNNTRAKVKQSVALRIAEEGQDAVLTTAVTEMEKFKSYRNKTLNAFAAQGQEPPPELLTRLDDLEKTTGQRVTWQMMRKSEAAQLANSFDGTELYRQELSTKSEIEDFVRPIATAGLQLQFQQDLIKTAQAGENLRKTRLENSAEIREQTENEQFGLLDSFAPNPTANELEKILVSGVAQDLGVSRSVAGKWATARLKTYYDNAKAEADIRNVNARTSTSLLKAKVDSNNTQKALMLGGLTTEKLRALTQDLTQSSGARTVGGVTITADDAAKALDNRLTLGEGVAAENAALIRGSIAERQNLSQLEEFEALNQWYTGSRNSATVRNAEFARQTALSEIENSFPAGPERDKQIALVNEAFNENNAELVATSKEALEANASDYDKRLANEFISQGSVSFTNDVTDAIANNPGFTNVIDQNSVFRAEADVFEALIARADPEGLTIDGSESVLFDVTNSARDVKSFLDSPYVIDETETSLSNRQFLRRNRHGSVQGVAAMKRLQYAESSTYKNEIVEATIFGGQNTENVQIFNESGQMHPEYRTSDGEFNFYKVMLEIHANSVEDGTENTVSSAVQDFRSAMMDRLSSRENGEQAFQDIKALTMPRDREESILSSMTQGELRLADGTQAYTLTASQDINQMLGRDFEENVAKAFNDYKKFLSELNTQSNVIRKREGTSSIGNFSADLSSIRSTPDPKRVIMLGIREAQMWTPNPDGGVN